MPKARVWVEFAGLTSVKVYPEAKAVALRHASARGSRIGCQCIEFPFRLDKRQTERKTDREKSISPVSYPHLHPKYGARIGRPELTRGHLPTGRVSLVDVLTFVIEQVDVKPLRSDWCEILKRAQRCLEKIGRGHRWGAGIADPFAAALHRAVLSEGVKQIV